jgi:hypothetical protein
LRCQGQTTGTCGPMVPMTPECTPRARTPSGTRPGHPANEVCPTRTFPGCMSSISTTTVTTTTVTTAASVTTTTLGGCLNPGEYPDSASCETAAVAETDYCVAPTAPSVCYNLVRCPTGSYTISSGECPRLIFEAEHQACIPSGSQPLCERYKDCGSDYIEESVCNSACSPTSCTLRGNGCFRCPSATTTTVTNTTNTTYCLPSGHLVLQYQCTESCADEYGRSRCWCSTYGEGPCPYNGPEPAMPTPGCCSGRLRGYDINMGVKLDWEKLRMILGIENAYATCNFAPPMHPIHYTVKWECE